MIKVLFVCHGNICRSPLAQSVFAHLVKEVGLEGEFSIDSFATSTEEIGNPPHPGTVQMLRQQKIPLIAHRAKQITRADYAAADYILVMDGFNVRNLHRLLGGDPQGKVHKLLDFSGRPGDIADPWYTGNFDATFRDVMAGCRGLLAHLQRES